MGSNHSSLQVRLQKKPRLTQQELQRQYQRNLSDQRLAEHMSARQALESSTSFARSQDFKQIPGINGQAPSVIASTANNESFYHQKATTLHSSSGAARNAHQNFRWIDGRRHHNVEGAAYILPNDIDEMDRLHLQHYVVRHAFEGNTRAKFDGSIHKDVLDVVDATQGLPFEDDTFDFVYQRFMIMGYLAKDWPFVIQELVRVTKPGGIIELTEIPLVSNANGPELTRLLAILEHGCVAKGLDTKVAKKLDGMLREAGLVDVKACHASIPVGAWGAKVGQLMRENSAGLWSSLKGWIKELTHLNDAQYEAMIRRIFVEYETHRCYVNCYCAWGVKPQPAQPSTSPSQALSAVPPPSVPNDNNTTKAGLNLPAHAAVV
ncbi:hypothetical protein EC968_000339 [Mortierella alpina]|nr:hypothetical protein EC968_000339 [Mortierella alpina]